MSFTNMRSDFLAPTLLQGIDGIGISEQASIIGFNRVPPDHNGAVGPDHVISLLNHVMQIYDKSGNLISTQTLEGLFGVVAGAATLPVDPNILYDAESGRFVYVSFEVLGTTGGPINPTDDQVRLNVAVSKTSDPTDGWHVSSIDAKTFIGGQNTWSDYPGVAIDGEAIYITANMFDFDAGPDGARDFKGNRLWIIDKGEGNSGLYDGGAINFSVHDPVASATDLSGLGVANATLMPARLASPQGGSGIYLVSTSGLSSGASEIAQFIRVTDPLGTPDFTAQSVLLGDISNENLNFLPQASQPGTTQTLGSGDARVNSGAAVWFEDKLYFTFSVSPKAGPNAGQTTTHWVEIDASNPNALSLIQQGDIGGEDIAPNTHTFESSINVNKDGTVLINFSASGPTVFPGAYYALRAADDPVGQFGPAQTLSPGVDWYFRNRAGEGISPQTTNRWGDFSGVAVDPFDETTFWFFNQFADTRGSLNAAGQDGRWRATVGSARATIQNFQFSAGDDDEDFYGGLGADGLVIHSLGVASALDVSTGAGGSIALLIDGGVDGAINAHFVETIIFDGTANADNLSITGGLPNLGAGGRFFNVFGGDGADTLTGDSFAAPYRLMLDGGGQSDLLTGSSGMDLLVGGLGQDTLIGAAGDDTLRGEADDDQLFSGFGDDRAEGGGGDDLVRTGPGRDTLLGGAGNDTLGASNKSDLLRGEAGRDLLLGSNGNDRLFGGASADTLLGGNGRDTLSGESGFDRLRGQDGNDVLEGGAGGDFLDGDAGTDTASYANAGAGVQVRLWNGDGTAGDALDDTLLEIENLAGSAHDDTLTGDAGANRIDGNAGDDIIQGLDGDDQLIGDRGDDLLIGGAGNDTFLYFAGDGADVITDFQAGAGSDDAIRLFNLGPVFDTFAEVLAAASDVSGDAVIDFGGGDQITLQGVSTATLHQDDFVFG